MFKLFAVILISAVCMSPIVMGDAIADARANNNIAMVTSSGSGIHNLNPAAIDFYGYQIGLPLLAPNVGLVTDLYAAALEPRSYIGKSNPVLLRDIYADRFVGESSLGIVAL